MKNYTQTSRFSWQCAQSMVDGKLERLNKPEMMIPEERTEQHSAQWKSAVRLQVRSRFFSGFLLILFRLFSGLPLSLRQGSASLSTRERDRLRKMRSKKTLYLFLKENGGSLGVKSSEQSIGIQMVFDSNGRPAITPDVWLCRTWISN